MQPRKPLTKEQALAIAADALREVGLERHAWMIEVPLRLELSDELAKLGHTYEGDYEERYCVSCGYNSYDLHDENCFMLHTWKFLGDSRYQQHVERVAQEAADAARRKAEREEYERTRCTAKGTGRCRLREGHDGVHDWFMPVTTGGLSGMLKELYSPARIENIAYENNPLLAQLRANAPAGDNFFGVDRSVATSLYSSPVAPQPPLTMDGIVDSLFPQRVTVNPMGYFDEQGRWFPNKKPLPADDPASKLITDLKKEPSVIVSPFIKEGAAYLFNNTLAVSPSDARAHGLPLEETPSQTLKRALEELKKLGGK